MNQYDDIPIVAKPSASLDEVYRNCVETQTPALIPLNHYADDRGFSLFGIFPEVLRGGQVNYTVQYPNLVKAWHRHENQTDFWCVLHGMLRIGIMSVGDSDQSDETKRTGRPIEVKQRWMSVIGERRPAVIVIPPMLWHGAVALSVQPAGLLYYVTAKYNPHEPDEQRQPHDWLWNPWFANHR